MCIIDHYPLGNQGTEISGGLNISEELGRDSRCLNPVYNTISGYPAISVHSEMPFNSPSLTYISLRDMLKRIPQKTLDEFYDRAPETDINED